MSKYENITIPWRGWQVVREIGKGGYGTVYEIERTQSGITDRAALKVIRVPKNEYEYNEVAYALSDEEGARTYFIEQKNKVINEIGAMQKLKATGNIVSIEDWHVYELEDGYSWEMYIRMELLTPLKESLKKHGNLTEEEVIKLGKDICKALILCEKEGIVHRDIKPDNIMVTAHGDYKLGDFGIARNLSNETTLTGVFSPAYVAPEVYNHKKAGKTIDTYSLGLVLYELLNNRRPPFLDAKGVYSGLEREQAIRRRLGGEEIPEPAYGSPELKRVVLKACSYNPGARYKTATDFRKALGKITITEAKKTDVVSLEDLEKDLFGELPEKPEHESAKKIEKFSTLYRKNEEFQTLLDEEYNRLKGDNNITGTTKGNRWYEDSDTVGPMHKQANAQNEQTSRTQGPSFLQKEEPQTVTSNPKHNEELKELKEKKATLPMCLWTAICIASPFVVFSSDFGTNERNAILMGLIVSAIPLISLIIPSDLKLGKVGDLLIGLLTILAIAICGSMPIIICMMNSNMLNSESTVSGLFYFLLIALMFCSIVIVGKSVFRLPFESANKKMFVIITALLLMLLGFLFKEKISQFIPGDGAIQYISDKSVEVNQIDNTKDFNNTSEKTY